MKLLFSSIVLATLSNTAHSAGTSFGSMNSCTEQAGCLQVTVNEVASKCGSPVCEFEVCWQQLTGASGPACGKFGDVQYVGDMHRFGDFENTADGGCVNPDNAGGKGYWDETCTDPENVYSSGVAFQSFFSGVCQVVSPGQTAHLLVNDGASCSGAASIPAATGDGLTAQCLPSTQDPTSATGQTFFPASEGPGGTCSGEDEGYECVWAITVPSACEYEEGPFICDTSIDRNDETVCEDDGSVLNYYEHDRNDAPPEVPIHDIVQNGDGTVSFRVLNPFGDDVHDLYTVYHEAADDGNEECNMEEEASSCASDTVLTAECLNNGTYTVVTVFAGGYTASAGAPSLVMDAESEGNEIYKCCPVPEEESFETTPANVAAWTYVIYCECPEATRRLRAGNQEDSLAAKFQRGELFDERTKQFYGISN